MLSAFSYRWLNLPVPFRGARSCKSLARLSLPNCDLAVRETQHAKEEGSTTARIDVALELRSSKWAVAVRVPGCSDRTGPYQQPGADRQPDACCLCRVWYHSLTADCDSMTPGADVAQIRLTLLERERATAEQHVLMEGISTLVARRATMTFVSSVHCSPGGPATPCRASRLVDVASTSEPISIDVQRCLRADVFYRGGQDVQGAMPSEAEGDRKRITRSRDNPLHERIRRAGRSRELESPAEDRIAAMAMRAIIAQCQYLEHCVNLQRGIGFGLTQCTSLPRASSMCCGSVAHGA